MATAPETRPKTFYLETFGCQMNVHDSEKVVGSLVEQGYRQVETVEEAGLVLYNTCSIRDKAEQKVFHRLMDFRRLEREGKKFGVLGCVAQQEGERIFERAPHVSLVCGSASYRRLPELLVQVEAGKRAAGLADRDQVLTKQEVFRSILRSVESDPARVLVVGDRPASEIRAGKELGMRTVRIRHGEFASLEPEGSAQRADHEIKKIAHLRGLPFHFGPPH